MNISEFVYQIVSPRENKPIITIVQDTLLGINKLTKGEIIKYPSINFLIHIISRIIPIFIQLRKLLKKDFLKWL